MHISRAMEAVLEVVDPVRRESIGGSGYGVQGDVKDDGAGDALDPIGREYMMAL